MVIFKQLNYMNQFSTPILFVVFNRLDTTQRVFDEIKKQKPKYLYIAADGSRENKAGEAEKCQQVRDIVKQIDWNCELKTLFHPENLGCKLAVSSAITWFFDNVERGIILEDDCLPSQSFFKFCEELLFRYENDLRIWNIGGHSPSYLKGDSFSYNFSRYTHIWGWATWASRWKNYDISLTEYKKNKNLLHEYEYFHRGYENKSRIKILEKLLQGKIGTWDYQWNYTVRINNGLSIRPKVSLIENIGFGLDATHTRRKIFSGSRKNSDIEFPLKHPDTIMIYKKDDYKHGKIRNSKILTLLIDG